MANDSSLSLTDLANALAGDYTQVKVAQASTPLSGQTVSTAGVNPPAVAGAGGVNWKSPYVIGAGAVALGLVLVVMLRPRRK